MPVRTPQNVWMDTLGNPGAQERGISCAKMKIIRKLHFWIGVLFAPTIFFFALSGGLQILGLHEGRNASKWIAELALIHKDQQVTAAQRPQRRPEPSDVAPAHDAQPAPAPPHRSPLLIVFFLMMSVGLMLSTVLGVYMAFAYKRDRRVIWGLLFAGVAIPVIGLFL